MTTTTPRMDPATRLVRSLPGEYFRVSEVALMLGVTERRLRDYVKSKPDELGPSYCVFMGENGKGKIYLYTREDIDKIREHLKKMRRIFPARTKGVGGRPRKWTDDQRQTRQRLYSRAHYYRLRLAEAEDSETQQDYQARIAAVEAQLKKMERT